MRKVIFLICLVFFFNQHIEASQVSLQPGSEGKDSCTWNHSNPNDLDWGDEFYIEIYKNNSSETYGYIEFDLSSVNFQTIKSATLELYLIPWQDGAGPNAEYIYVNRITEPWDENDLRSYNRPAYNTDNEVVNNSILQEGHWGYWDVTSIVQDWINGTYNNYGFRLHTISNFTNSLLASSDYSDSLFWPKLNIEEGTLNLFLFSCLLHDY